MVVVSYKSYLIVAILNLAAHEKLQSLLANICKPVLSANCFHSHPQPFADMCHMFPAATLHSCSSAQPGR